MAAILAAAGVMYAVLLALGLASWRRTRRLRGGMPVLFASRIRIAARSSPATWLAACTGASIWVWGALSIAEGLRLGWLPLIGGALVSVSGFRRRVTAVAADDRGLTIRYQAAMPFTASWTACQGLRPPRSPLGGWRIQAGGAATTLMPSDLWGHEELLDAVVDSALLRFDGRAWRRMAWPTPGDSRDR